MNGKSIKPISQYIENHPSSTKMFLFHSVQSRNFEQLEISSPTETYIEGTTEKQSHKMEQE